MQSSIASADSRRLLEVEPRTEEELLEREDRRARDDLRDSARLLGEDVVDALDLRRQVRRHPTSVLLTGLCGGFVLSRPILGLIGPKDVRAALTALSRIAIRFAGLGMVGNVVNAVMSDYSRKQHVRF